MTKSKLLKHVDSLKFLTIFSSFAKFFENCSNIFRITFFAIFKIIILFKKIIIILTSSQQSKCYYNFSVQDMTHRKPLKTQENAYTVLNLKLNHFEFCMSGTYYGWTCLHRKFGSKSKQKNNSLWYNLFQVFFTLTSLTADRPSFVQVTADRKVDWIVPDRTRSYQVKPDRRFWIFWGIKSYLTFFTIFNIWRNQSKCSTGNAKKIKVIMHMGIDLLFGHCNNNAVHYYTDAHCNMHLVRRVLVGHLNK